MENKKRFRPDLDLKLMDQARQILRYYHYARKSGDTLLINLPKSLNIHNFVQMTNKYFSNPHNLSIINT